LHSTFTQTDNENFDSSWQADLTIVITSSGTVVTGSVSGSDDADGAATFIAHDNGVSDSSTSGSEFSSESHNDWTSISADESCDPFSVHLFQVAAPIEKSISMRYTRHS
jgi:hypothetical protein